MTITRLYTDDEDFIQELVKSIEDFRSEYDKYYYNILMNKLGIKND